MKLYLTAAGIYAGTQQEAKADGKGWKPEEVPVSKYELIDYLNKLKFNTTAPEPAPEPTRDEIVNSNTLEMQAKAREIGMATSHTATSTEEFILNDATVAQVEQIFARLGTRFKELVKRN